MRRPGAARGPRGDENWRSAAGGSTIFVSSDHGGRLIVRIVVQRRDRSVLMGEGGPDGRALVSSVLHSERIEATDEDLVFALRGGDTESLSVLVGRWEQPLNRFVHRMLPRPEDAQDVCQETFLRVLNKSHRFREGSRFSTWLYQIALNLCRDQARRRKRWRLLVADDQPVNEENTSAEFRPGALDPAEEASRRELGDAVKKALGGLPPDQREVLVLKEFEGLKFREIAEILGCPESTVKSRMYGGLNGLRSALVHRGVNGC